MSNEPTDLDKLRREYVAQIFDAIHNSDEETAVSVVDELLMEWGATAYRRGREHMAERLKRCADEWKTSSG